MMTEEKSKHYYVFAFSARLVASFVREERS